MASMKMINLFVVMMAIMIAATSAQEAPAPAPTSDAAVFVPTAIASLSALIFAYMF
ncbi:arabinogalactan peptide 13 [Artemisia annua]|uniref:Arabinogalactan peptide 13 n=1 Tax=Artemisia annua TaxID=35608 RepID=A0A2U1KDY3_ARTAN|nr:arabinogalactan peptide 13 [Artemisia annua]